MRTERYNRDTVVWGAVLLISLVVNVIPVPFWVDAVFYLFGLCYIVHVFLHDSHRSPSPASHLVCAFAACVMIVGLYFGERFGYFSYLEWDFTMMLPFGAYCYLLFLALSCDDRLFSAGAGNGPQKPRPAEWLCLSLFLFLILIALYWKDYPYLKSPDTQNQWDQIHNVISYNKIHSIGHTIFLKILLAIWDDFRFVIVVHLLGILGLYLLFASWFCAKGIHIKTIALVEGLCLLWTGLASEVIFSPQKDLPSALCLGVVTYFLLRLQDQKTLSCGEAFALGLALAWTALFRLNGIIAAAVCGLVFFVTLWRRSLFCQIGVMLLAAVLSAAGVKCCSDLILKPVDYENGFAVQVFASGIASVAAHDQLLPEEEAAVSEILSVDWMKTCYINSMYKQKLIWFPDGSERIAENADLEIFNNDFVLALGANKKDVILLYLKLLPRHLPVMLKDLAGNIKLFWSLDRPGLSNNHVFLTLLLLVLAVRIRLGIRELAVFLPCICNVLSIAISTITNEIRYFLPSFLLLPFFLLFLLWKGAPCEAAEN